MEDIYPEIALHLPKTDPRTVLFHKRNFMESSSDHIQEEFLKNSLHKTTTAKCDKFKNNYENSNSLLNTHTNTTTTATTTLVFNTSSSLLSTTTLSSSSSSSLLSTILVNFSKSCHFNASLNNLYKLQKTSE